MPYLVAHSQIYGACYQLMRVVGETMQQVQEMTSDRVSKARKFLRKLYTTFDEALSSVGVEDWTTTAVSVNVLISMHEAIQHVGECRAKLTQITYDMRAKFSWLTQRGLPLPFLVDQIVASIEHIIERIKEKKQDLYVFQSFNQPPTSTNIKNMVHQLAQLFF